jgi:hypothetical protein
MTENRNIKRIPIDRQRVRDDGEFFGRSFTQHSPARNQGEIVFSVKIKDVTLDYRFDENKSKELKQILKLDPEKNAFALGRRAVRLWYSLILLAAKQGKGTTGTFRIVDIAQIWECERSGKFYNDIKQTFLSLASFSPHYYNNKTGEDRIEWGHSFLDAWLIRGEGNSAVFSFELNKVALGITADWLENKSLSFSSLKRGYLSLKVEELKKERSDPKYENFLERVRLLKPGSVEVKFETVLTDWIKTGNDMLRRRLDCHNMVQKYLKTAQDEGELKTFQLQNITLSKWRENWRVSITK